MALSKPGLRDLIKSQVEAATGNTMSSAALDVWEAVASAIVEHVTENAVVSVTTSCPAGAGTGTGTVA